MSRGESIVTLSKRERERLLKLSCGVINDDDAIDPRHYFYNKRKPRNKNRKVYQLCRQVADTLQLVLCEEDMRLELLNVVDVVPAPDSRRMLVLVEIDAARPIESASEIDLIMAALVEHVPRLRAEIARTINRRKTPQLVFEISKFVPRPDKGFDADG